MLITRIAMGKNLYKMFRWINDNDAIFVKELDSFRREYTDLLGLKEWIKLHFKPE